MKDLIIDWVEEHKGENPDGTWFRLDMDWMENDPEHPEVFKTENELDDWLWKYAAENPDCYLPDP